MLTLYTVFIKLHHRYNVRRKSDRVPRRFVNKQNTSYYMCAESSCVGGDFFIVFTMEISGKKG